MILDINNFNIHYMYNLYKYRENASLEEVKRMQNESYTKWLDHH